MPTDRSALNFKMVLFRVSGGKFGRIFSLGLLLLVIARITRHFYHTRGSGTTAAHAFQSQLLGSTIQLYYMIGKVVDYPSLSYMQLVSL